MGKSLWIDLTRRKAIVKPTGDELIGKFLGGIGFCIKILYDMTCPETDPLGPDNVIIFASGPVSGTLWPASGRLQVAAKSPLTGLIGYSNSGGRFGPFIKYSGFDFIVLKGRSARPVYIVVYDGKAEIYEATDLWGLDTWSVEDEIKSKHGDVEVACIGPAGENLVRYSCIMTSKFRAAARTGLGSVLGSKKVKAVAVGGSRGVEVANPERFFELVDKAEQLIKESPFTKTYSRYGTPLLVEPMSHIGRLPTRNHQTGVFPLAEKIGCEALERFKVASRSCFSCSFHCKQVLRLDGVTGDHPEYETLCSLGSRVYVGDLESIIRWNWLCDKLGLDTISTGASIAWAMECYEKGIITEEDTGGLKLKWGDKNVVDELIRMIAYRRGFGDLLSLGVKRASKIIGRGSSTYAMEVKGLEIPAQDGRAQKSMGLAHATASRGADHLTHCTFLDEIGFEDAVRERFGEEYLPEMADRFSPKFKGLMARENEDMTIAASCMVMCVTGGWLFPPLFWWRELAEVYSSVTGIEMDVKKLKLAADRIAVMRRAYLIKHGVSRADDRLPERFLREPAPEGACKGQVVELNEMLDEYYMQRGWDVKTGLIPRRKLEMVGLSYVAEDLERIGKLPR